MSIQGVSSAQFDSLGALPRIPAKAQQLKQLPQGCVEISPMKVRLKKHLDITRKAFQISQTVVDVTYKIFKYLYKSFKPLLSLSKLLKPTKVLEIFLVPFSLMNFASLISSLRHGDRSKRIDVTLEATKELGSIKNSLTAFSQGLETVGFNCLKLLKTSSVLGIASTVFSISSLITNYRAISEMQKLKNRIDQIGNLKQSKGETTLEDYRAVLALLEREQIKDKRFLKRLFNYDEDKLADRLIAIDQTVIEKIHAGDSQQVVIGQKLLYRTLKCLKGRLEHNINAYKTTTALALTGLFSCAAFFTPSAAAAAVGGTIICVGRIIHHKYAEYSFSHHLRLKRKWHEWIIC